MKESQLLGEKKHFLNLCFNMFRRCACPVSLTCIHTQHRAMWRRLLAVDRETLPIDRWHAYDRTTGEDLRARARSISIAIEVKHDHETLPAKRTRLLAAPVQPNGSYWSRSTVLACGMQRRSNGHCSPTRDGHQPVMTGDNARRPRTGRERRPWWWLSEASYLTVWTLNDRLFASLVHCMLGRLLSEYWRKETEKSKVFCGVVGLDGRCSAQAEQRKNPRQLAHYGVVTCRQKQSWSRFVAWWERSLIPDRDTHTHRHTELKCRGPPGPRR